MKKILLVLPTMEELKYRQDLMKDPETMAYNAGYDVDIKGYDKENGTITKTDEEMIEWYHKWINKEPDKYYAYIYGVEEQAYVGEIYYYPDGDIHSMGIVIDSKYRGKGYAYLALLELEKVAFERYGINELSDIIPLDRIGAIKSFKKAGFVHTDLVKSDKNGEARQLLITKDQYFANKSSKLGE